MSFQLQQSQNSVEIQSAIPAFSVCESKIPSRVPCFKAGPAAFESSGSSLRSMISFRVFEFDEKILSFFFISTEHQAEVLPAVCLCGTSK